MTQQPPITQAPVGEVQPAKKQTSAPPTERQCVKYSFFKVDPAFRRLPPERQAELKLELIHTIRGFNRRMLLRAYTLFGVRGDVDFMLWQVADEIDAFVDLATAIFSTGMAAYLHTPHSLLGMTRRSIYDIGVGSEAEETERIIIQPGDGKYLFVYPFVKTRSWYALPHPDRQRMMTEHITVGRKYPQFKLNTIYSFGLDDQEFVVAFEGDTSSAFLDLVMELRETEASAYTLRDTPTFSCINMTLAETLDSIGGASIAKEAGPDVPTQEGGWLPTVPISELPPGQSTRVYFGSQQVALFNVDGQIYAVNNRCPHARGPLCEGAVNMEANGPAVTCPWHDAAFDLRTGTALHGPIRTPTRPYSTRIDSQGMILIAEKTETDVVDESAIAFVAP